LIRGQHSAVLVDTPITIKQTEDLAAWIKDFIPHKKLTNVFITHGHGDHCMGIKILQDRFHGLKAVATKGTIAHMRQQFERKFFARFWRGFFPDEGVLTDVNDLVIADPLPDDGVFELEGHSCERLMLGLPIRKALHLARS